MIYLGGRGIFKYYKLPQALKRAPKIVDSQVGRIWKLKHEKKTFLGESWLGEFLGESCWIDLKKKNLSGGNFGEGKNKEKKTAQEEDCW